MTGACFSAAARRRRLSRSQLLAPERGAGVLYARVGSTRLGCKTYDDKARANLALVQRSTARSRVA